MERSTLKHKGENSAPACSRHHRNTSENVASCGGMTCSTRFTTL
jgi:hypothetical protein